MRRVARGTQAPLRVGVRRTEGTREGDSDIALYEPTFVFFSHPYIFSYSTRLMKESSRGTSFYRDESFIDFFLLLATLRMHSLIVDFYSYKCIEPLYRDWPRLPKLAQSLNAIFKSRASPAKSLRQNRPA
jgi:hypothetical protein